MVSCAKEKSEHVYQDSIYSIYELHYNKTEDKTTASASFRFGGPTGILLDITDPAQVTFEGDKLLSNSSLGIYAMDYANFKDFGTFKYIDLDGKVFINSIPKINPIDFNAIDTIPTDSAYTFSWSGLSVQNLETVSITIDGTTQDNFEIFSTSTLGKTQIILDSIQLDKIGKGFAKCTLRRAYNTPSIAGGTSKGGRIHTYYDIEKTVYVK